MKIYLKADMLKEFFRFYDPVEKSRRGKVEGKKRANRNFNLRFTREWERGCVFGISIEQYAK